MVSAGRANDPLTGAAFETLLLGPRPLGEETLSGVSATAVAGATIGFFPVEAPKGDALRPSRTTCVLKGCASGVARSDAVRE